MENKQQLCLSSTCRRCDMGYILKDYVHPLMQLLTNDISNFHMGLLTTKCLNTAVMLMYFMVGKKGLKAADVCDCTRFRQNSLATNDPLQNTRITKSLTRSILSRRCSRRELFYILITDADFPFPQNKSSNDIYFPGHVIVIEKVPPATATATATALPTYNFYQSYIYEYDLKGHYLNNNRTFSVDHSRMKSLLASLNYVMSEAKTWDKMAVEAWKNLTFVDTSKFLGADCQNRFFICYRKMKALHCIENIEKYAKKSLAKLEKTETPFKAPYGNTQLYNGDVRALSKFEMKLKMENLVNDIIRHKHML